MSVFKELAIQAFKEGSDNFGEIPTGEATPIRRVIYTNSPNQREEFYTVTVYLMQNNGRACTSGIGFYVRNGKVKVCSGHVLYKLDITEEMQAELDAAEKETW